MRRHPRTLAAALAALAALVQLPRPIAALQVCAECIGDWTPGEDAGAYKDIAVPSCQGACHCNKPGSPCWDPAVGASMARGRRSTRRPAAASAPSIRRSATAGPSPTVVSQMGGGAIKSPHPSALEYIYGHHLAIIEHVPMDAGT